MLSPGISTLASIILLQKFLCCSFVPLFKYDRPCQVDPEEDEAEQAASYDEAASEAMMSSLESSYDWSSVYVEEVASLGLRS